jgi:hypothetical protein
MTEIYNSLKNEKVCPRDLKYDYFNFFEVTLDPNSPERLTLSYLLHNYPMNDNLKENWMINLIEDLIDNIYSKLKD